MVKVVIYAWSGHSVRAAHSWHVVAAAAAAAMSSAADTVWA